MDEFLAENQIDPRTVNAVRMDLEGHELNVLRGMTDVLSAEGPLVLFVEFHPDFGDRKKYEDTITTLDEHGFTIRSTDQKWNMLDIYSVEELRSVTGSHVRAILSRGL